jgi:hypothetical protein
LWRQGHLSFDHSLKKFISRMLVTCGGTIVVFKSFQALLQPLFIEGELIRDLSVTGLVAAGFLSFLLLAHMMGAMKFHELKLMFART